MELQFSKRNPSAFERVISSLGFEPNAYATGFIVGDRLVMTAYHVVSGNLNTAKKLTLGFGREDELKVRIFTNGCQAKVIKVDEEADLALLQVCRQPGQAGPPSFQSTIMKDEKLWLIAKPRRERIVGHGTFFGSYAFRGIEFWSVSIAGGDGFSGSPVYNEKGEIIGVFSGYDWSQKLAVISPGARAEKLVLDFIASKKP